MDAQVSCGGLRRTACATLWIGQVQRHGLSIEPSSELRLVCIEGGMDSTDETVPCDMSLPNIAGAIHLLELHEK
jgi:hypothetical protein